jgi:tRNA-2-methylthio-N6-dimethylallyladenosine synthase
MIQHNLRSSKLKVKDWKFEKWNFLGTLQTKEPDLVWFTNKEVEDYKPKINWNLKTVFVNNAFNPIFHKLSQKRKNIELFWRIDDTGFLPLMLNKLWYHIKYDKELVSEYDQILPEWIQTSMNSHSSTAYVPISTWCNQFCAYCIVPYARWLEKYFDVEKIVNECKSHLQNWAQEIVLLWQIVNKHPHFVEIIKKILKLDWLKRLRYTSPYPTYYSDELLNLHENEPKLCPHIHIPLQSGSSNVLKNMFRWYDADQAKEFIQKIKNLKRKISLTTDIIVGFSWETEQDFEQTIDMVRFGWFDMIYIWIYSPRPGTLATKKYADDVTRKIKRNRWNRLNDELNKTSLENNKKEVWNTVTVLVNEILDKWDEITYLWYTDNMKQIIIRKENIENKNIKVWDFVSAKIIDWVPFKLMWVI